VALIKNILMFFGTLTLTTMISFGIVYIVITYCYNNPGCCG